MVLAEAGHNVVLLDNLSNSSLDVVNRLLKITKVSFPFVKADVRDTDLVKETLRRFKIDAVMHFAGLKSVAESVSNPNLYYDNNVVGSVSLVAAMNTCKVKKLVFSSSATVYGEPQYLPIDEQHPKNPINPYGRSKLFVEDMLRDQADSDPDFGAICLRYFNPVGAHESGLINEESSGIPNNLVPYILKVASGELPYLNIFGDDYDTPDGTGVRDYIHVMDLARGHLAALNYIEKHRGWDAINLGTGKGQSVLEIVNSIEKSIKKIVPYKIVPRRAGDAAVSYSRVDRAFKTLGWSSRNRIDEAFFINDA